MQSKTSEYANKLERQMNKSYYEAVANKRHLQIMHHLLHFLAQGLQTVVEPSVKEP